MPTLPRLYCLKNTTRSVYKLYPFYIFLFHNLFAENSYKHNLYLYDMLLVIVSFILFDG